MTAYRLRLATMTDAEAICRIYNQGIEDRVATLETELRTPDERRGWLASRGPRHPVVVVEFVGSVVAGSLRPGPTEGGLTQVRPGSVSADNPQVRPGSVSADNPQVRPGSVSADNPQVRPGSVSADNPQVRPGSVSADNPQVRSGGVSADNSQARPSSGPADNPLTRPGSVSADNPLTRRGSGPADSPQARPGSAAADSPFSADNPAGVIAWASLNVFNPRECYRFVADISVYVERGWRGKGVGRVLLEKLTELGREHGFHKLVLSAFPGNAGGMALYAKSGFRTVGIYHEQGQLDGKWVDTIIMEKLLSV